VDETSLLVELVKAYSPSGAESEAVHVFTQIAESLGFRTEVDGIGNGIARIGSGRPLILFLGHIDTVEGEIPVRVEEGVVHGRGTCDAKGALVAALLAAKDHAGPGEIVVVAAVGEERDSRGARHLIPRHDPDFLIVGEPSGSRSVTVGYKGVLEVALTFEGERSHHSAPGPSTVESALAVIPEIRGFCATRAGGSPFAALTAKIHAIHTVQAGSRETVEMRVNFRIPPGVTTTEILEFLDRGGITYRVIDRSEAVVVDATNEVVRALVAGIREHGVRPTLVRKAGTSDMNLAVPVWGCPAAAYGPGDAHLDHTDAERISLADFSQAVQVLRSALLRLVEGGPRDTSPPGIRTIRAEDTSG